MSSTKLEVQREIAARLDQDRSRKEQLLGGRGRRSCSEQGPHPGHHLWGTRRSRKRTSAPQMGVQNTGMRTALILRSRRSWPVAPITSTRWGWGIVLLSGDEAGRVACWGDGWWKVIFIADNWSRKCSVTWTLWWRNLKETAYKIWTMVICVPRQPSLRILQQIQFCQACTHIQKRLASVFNGTYTLHFNLLVNEYNCILLFDRNICNNYFQYLISRRYSTPFTNIFSIFDFLRRWIFIYLLFYWQLSTYILKIYKLPLNCVKDTPSTP